MTARLAAYAAGLEPGAVPRAVLGQARTVLADTLGCLLCGSTHRNVDLAVAALAADGGDGAATVATRGRIADAPLAALLNGVAIHVTDLDDSHAPSRTHPAAVVVPAAMAAAEVAGGCSGLTLLAGIVVGYDVTARLGKAMGVRGPFGRGFHSGAVCGAVGAAVAAGRILALPADRMASCIALGASQSCGLTTYEEDPSQTINAFQMGLAARAGVTAALLARPGFAPVPDVLTGRKSMLRAFSPVVDAGQLADGLGSRFEICDTSMKRHACCGQAHAAVDALLMLRAGERFEVAGIERIEVELSHDALAIMGASPLPTHNIAYVLAIAALEGRVSTEHFAEPWLSSEAVSAMMRRVHARGSDALQQRLPRHKGGVVTVHTSAGSRTRHVPAPRGNPAAPWSPRELRAKFLHLARLGGVGAERARTLWTLVRRLHEAPAVEPLLDLLAAPPDAP